jgi:hypothetical protein
MNKESRSQRLMISLALGVMFAGHSFSHAADLDREKKALDIIADFTDKFCKDVSRKGNITSAEASGDAKAKLKGVVNKLADLGFEGAAKYKSENYEGLLRTDLLPALRDNQTCRLQIWKDLKAGLLGPTPNRPKTGSAIEKDIAISVAIMGMNSNFASSSAMTVSYNAEKKGKKTVISPINEYLEHMRNGGPVSPVHFVYTPFKWDFPTLDIKIVNNSDKTIFINEGILNVQHSELDSEPILLIRPDSFRSNALHFRILNDGWRVARNVKINFNLDPLVEKDHTPLFTAPYDHALTIADIEASSNVNVASAFVKAGVEIDKLKDLGVISAIYVGGESTVTVRDTNGKEVTMTQEEFEKKRASLFGPFVHGGALLSGVISYDWLQPKGDSKHNELRFSTVVWIYDLNARGAPAPPTYGYSTKLEVNGNKYVRRVNMSQAIKPGDTDRFTLQIGVEKSSLHTFDLQLMYNDSKILHGGSFQLGIFVPRTAASYMAREASNHKSPVERFRTVPTQ